MLGSGAGAGQLGSLQQVKNMGDYADRTFRALVVATHDMAANAKAMQELHYYSSVLSLQFKSVMVQIVTALMPLFKRFAEDIFTLMMAISIYAQQFIEIGRFLKLIPGGQPGQGKLMASRGSSSGSMASPWERMGFVIGGFASHDYARQTAENTAEIARNTKGFADAMKGLIPFGGGKPAMDPNANYSFYHKITPLP